MFISAFVAFAFGVKLKKNHCQGLCQGIYSLFSTRTLMVSGFMFKSLIHLELIFFCVWHEESGPVFLIPFIEKTDPPLIFFFLGPHLWHTEVPRLGVEAWELQLPAYTTVRAMQDI